MERVLLFLGIFFFMLGFFTSMWGGILFIVRAFSVSLVWGLVYMFVPFGSLVFMIKHWDQAMEPFLISVVSAVLMGVSLLLMQGYQNELMQMFEMVGY